MHRRSAILATALLASTTFLAGCGDSTGPEKRQGVAIFMNPSYVEVNASDAGAEGSNTLAAITALGYSNTTFAGTDASSIAAAVKGKRTVVIPELEMLEGELPLDDAAKGAIKGYVQDGGTLVFLAGWSGMEATRAIFGWSLDYGTWDASDVFTLNTAAATSTPFAGGPATIAYGDGSDAIYMGAGAVLPTGAKAIYTTDVGDAAVLLVPYGKGRVVILGYDWYDPAADYNAPVYAGWQSVLDRALKY